MPPASPFQPRDLAALAATELFRDASAETLALVREHASVRDLAAGEILLSPALPNQHIYLLLAGALALRFDSPQAPEVRELLPGVSVGEMSIIDDAPPSAYVIAKVASRVFPIHRDLLQRLIAGSNPVARNLLRLMSQWLKANTRHIAADQNQIRRLTATIREVSAQGLDQRIPTTGEERDFAELIGVFNEMLERLERSFKQAARFSGDAAHELRTPLTILQGRLEQALHAVPSGSAMQVQLAGILDEVRRLSSISQKLLLLAQADGGRLSLRRERCDLTAALRDLAEDARMLAPALRVDTAIAPGLAVAADGGLLRQALHNLIGNAIKYNLADGWLRIDAAATDAGIKVRVANASLGIAAADRALIFERFHRTEAARSRGIAGSGLGLGLAREIARAHGGELTLDDSAGGETVFSLTLPSP
ncbi:MAG: cyclic nucleotide-binding domain-containing protein [Rhodocyclales bacterium]|nr:cyclic nucleotide-binding domain-containing protein [Rhodocyclales bacterium]